MSSASTEEQAVKIITELRGQSIVLPDLNAILGSWPRGVNRELARLRREVDEWLDRYEFSQNRLRKAFYLPQSSLT